jgi:hypothetical protein
VDIDDPEIMPKFLRQNFVFARNLHERPGILIYVWLPNNNGKFLF